MSEYSAQIGIAVQRFSVESLADMTIGWMNGRKLLANPPFKLPGMQPESIDSTIQCIARFVCVHVFYPRISTPFALINASIGTLHVGIAFSKRFQIIETPEKAPEKWQEVALCLHKGFAHLITAAYDFGIGYLLSQKPYGLIGVVAFVAAPTVVAAWHQRFFVKPGGEQIISEPVELPESFKVAAHLASGGSETVKNILNPTEQPSTPLEKVTPTYLDPRCYVYRLAKRVALNMLPSVQGTTVLPNYGL